jgi:hypothetical protein
MAFTGARILEILAPTVTRVDAADEAVIFETLKQRRKRVSRAVTARHGAASQAARTRQ